jgi:hypothetical protein
MRLQLGKFSRVFSLLVLPLITSAVASAGVTVTVSSPAAGSTVSSPTTIKASASSGYSITGWYIYVDNKAAWNTGATQTISASVNIPSGTHSIYVRAWDSSGSFGTSSTFNVTNSGSGTVAPSTGEPMPPAGAKLIDNIDQQTGWGHCTDCAADPSDPTPPIALWSFTQFQNTPSKDGSSAKMWIGGTTAYANALHWKKFGDQSAYKNFIWEFWIYGNADMNNAQNLEFDLFQAVSGRKYMFGTQCNYYKKIWQGWDETTNHWIDTTTPCPKFATGQWTRIKWYFQRTSDNRLHYVSVTVNNTTYKVDRYWNSSTTSWGNTFGVQFQQDLNKYAADYTVWADKVKVWMW